MMLRTIQQIKDLARDKSLHHSWRTALNTCFINCVLLPIAHVLSLCRQFYPDCVSVTVLYCYWVAVCYD